MFPREFLVEFIEYKELPQQVVYLPAKKLLYQVVISPKAEIQEMYVIYSFFIDCN
jgi:hypothetical protein